MFACRLQNSQFFLKIGLEQIKSSVRAPPSLALRFQLLFDCSLRKNTDCFAVFQIVTDAPLP